MNSDFKTLRIDKWLWYARFFKSRTLATSFCGSGKLRLNSKIVRKSHKTLQVGDVLTFSSGSRVRIIRIDALGSRRGPASEAQTLYEDLSVPKPRCRKGGKIDGLIAQVGMRDPGSGRPTKMERRATDQLRYQRE